MDRPFAYRDRPAAPDSKLVPGKIVFSESVGYRFQGPVLCRQESAPAINAISFAPRFNHAFLRLDSDRVATDFITSVLFNQKKFIERHSEGFRTHFVFDFFDRLKWPPQGKRY
jgi:hypothetical protein